MTCRDQMDTWRDASLVWWWRTPCCACACGRLSCSFIEVKTSIQRKICCCYPKSAVMYLYRKCHHVHLSNLTATCKLSRYWMWKSTWFLVWLNEIWQISWWMFSKVKENETLYHKPLFFQKKEKWCDILYCMCCTSWQKTHRPHRRSCRLKIKGSVIWKIPSLLGNCSGYALDTLLIARISNI